MALRLAGEQAGVLRGVDAVGWLREVTVSDALPGLKVDQLGAGRVVDFKDGGTSKLFVLDGGRVVVADSIEVGNNPATMGAVRLANGGAVVGRNAAGSADITAIRVEADDEIGIGDGATDIAIHKRMFPTSDNLYDLGSGNRWRSGYFGTSLEVGTNPATAGTIRLQNGGSVQGRNATNSANIIAIQIESDNEIGVGDGAVDIAIYKRMFPTSDNLFDLGSSNRWRNLYIGTAIHNGTVQLVSATQGAAVADASGGATVDAEARTAVNTLLARLRAHGLIAT